MPEKEPLKVSIKIGVFKNSAKFVGKHLRWKAFNPATFLKRDFSAGAFM